MNREHLRTFLWLRWRLRLNQLRRGGILASFERRQRCACKLASQEGQFVGFAGAAVEPEQADQWRERQPLDDERPDHDGE